MKYKQAPTFNEAMEVAEKKEVSIEEVPWPTMQSMVKTVQFSTEPKLWKHLKVSSRMELTMEQMINQMNQLSLHLLQLRASKNRNVEDLSTIQCYKCREMGHYSRECPNLPALPNKENVSSFTRRFLQRKRAKLKYINWVDKWRARKGFNGFGKEPQNPWRCNGCHGPN